MSGFTLESLRERARTNFLRRQAEQRGKNFFPWTVGARPLVMQAAEAAWEELEGRIAAAGRLLNAEKSLIKFFPLPEHRIAACVVAAETVMRFSFGDGSLRRMADRLGRSLDFEAMILHVRDMDKLSTGAVEAALKGSEDTQRVVKFVRRVRTYRQAFYAFRDALDQRGGSMTYEGMSIRERFSAAGVLISLIVDNSPAVHFDLRYGDGGRNKRWEVVPAEKAIEWLKETEESYAAKLTAHYPCIDPPLAWKDQYGGGYPGRTGHLFGRDHDEEFWPYKPGLLMDACNRLQRTGWSPDYKAMRSFVAFWDSEEDLPDGTLRQESSVNEYRRLYDDLSDLKAMKKAGENVAADEMARAVFALRYHLRHRRKLGKYIRAKAVIDMVLRDKEAEGERFFFDWTGDFRGRMYQGGGLLRPQGSDLARASWRFDEKPCPLEGAEYDYLYLELSSLLGYGKRSREERLEFVWDHLRKNYDPNAWKKSPSPWQAKRLTEALIASRIGGTNCNGIPVSLDASSHGFQIVAALMGDEPLGKASNLIGSPHCHAKAPENIYARVAEHASSFYEELASKQKSKSTSAKDARSRDHRYNGALRLLDRYFPELPTDLVKGMCVAYLYGSRPSAQTDKIIDDVRALFLEKEIFDSYADMHNTVAYLIAHSTYRALHDLYPAVKSYQIEMRKWCRALVETYGDSYADLAIVMPDGFTYRPARFDLRTSTVKVSGTRNISFTNGKGKKLSKPLRQREGFAVSFVHALESYAVRRIVTSFNGPLHINHDCFYTTASNMERLEETVRDVYTEVLHDAPRIWADARVATLQGSEYDPGTPVADAVLRSDGSNLSRNFLT